MNRQEKIIHYLLDYSELNSMSDSGPEAPIENILSRLGIKVSEITASMGATYSSYQVTPTFEPGIVRRLRHLEDDLAIELNVPNVRVIQTENDDTKTGIPQYIIEIPNRNRKIVDLLDMFMSKSYNDSNTELPISLGKDVKGLVHFADLAEMTHLLLYGGVGSGKTVFLHSLIASLIYFKTSEEVRFVLIDPKYIH